MRQGLWRSRNLYGQIEKPAKELAPLARSWNFPAELRLAGGEYESRGYDKDQRAYVLHRSAVGSPAPLEFTLSGSPRSPVLNPAFVVKSWGEGDAKLALGGKEVPRGKDLRTGHRRDLDGVDLVVWIRTESQATLYLRIEPR